MEPLDLGTVKHFLQIRDQEKFQISEPISFDAANFVTKQESERLGRDISFASGTVELTFSSHPNVEVNGLHHHFDTLLTELKTYGFEADVKYILNIDGTDYVVGQCDFAQPSTDLINFITCKVIQEHKQETLKRRIDIKVDLFSSLSLDDEPIEPLVPEKILMRSVPLSQKSEWEAPEAEYSFFIPGEGQDYFHNPLSKLNRYDIEDTLNPLNPQMYFDFDADDFKMIDSVNKLKLTKFYIDNVNIRYSGQLTDYIELQIHWYKGTEWSSFFDTTLIYNQTVAGNVHEINDFSYESPFFTMERGEKLFVVFKIRLSDTDSFNHSLAVKITSGEMRMETTAFILNSIVSGVKYIDAFKQVVKSICGLNVKAPEFVEGKSLHPQYIFDGLMCRGIEVDNFNITLEELIKMARGEWNGDYEIEDNENVFLGLWNEFFRDVKMGEFLQAPNEEYDQTFNARYSINRFQFGYSKYEKENNEELSRESVHTTLEAFVPNVMVNDGMRSIVPFVRDTFLIQSTRKDGIEVSDDTATKQDDNKFIVDVIEKALVYTEGFFLQQSVLNPTTLKLTNDGTFNWSLLGMTEGQLINISGSNEGFYYIEELGQRDLTLTFFSGVGPTTNNTELISITYNVTATNLTNRTDEGFFSIENISNPEGFSNLLFTQKRNIINYFSEYLGISTTFRRSNQIKITEFIHNGKLRTKLPGKPVIQEDESIATNNLPRPITPWRVKTSVFCDFPTYWQLQKDLRSVRGYVDIRTPEDEIIRIHPTSLDFEWAKGLLEIVGDKRIVDSGGSTNIPPVAELTLFDNDITVGTNSVIGLSASDSDGTIASWILYFNDGSPSESGTGQPPASVNHVFPVGSYTPTLVVTDDQGATAQDSDIIVVREVVDDLQINEETGEISGPAGTTIGFKIQIVGSGTMTGNAGVSSTQGGPNNLISGQVDNDSSDGTYDNIHEGDFIMPAGGSAWLTGSCSATGGGSPSGALLITISLLDEQEVIPVNVGNTFP